ncbi:EF-hand domain-containing protein [Pontibacter oryzae]|uniref:EF-hand domain-containing protein n=1 Tax=Pontibacter oryzae TaxID=2304593 RepID=A0A399RR21_9BACT|nr:hypothetical protein [Pontibacter oryzae]RIJ34290.1 hypothetical protein D1627_15310 [Pontibacter oryzae]
MEKRMYNIGPLLTLGLCCSIGLSLLSCKGDEKKEMIEEPVSMRTEATESFAGDMPAIDSDRLYSDFSATSNFENWDTDKDNLLNENEYADAFFNTWDTDNDKMLNQNEWEAASGDFGFRNNADWEWAAWDANKDDAISKKEFSARLSETNTFEGWDKNKDNMLDEREYTEGLIVMWNDADDDGTLDETEYTEKFKRYYDNNEKQYLPERG